MLSVLHAHHVCTRYLMTICMLRHQKCFSIKTGQVKPQLIRFNRHNTFYRHTKRQTSQQNILGTGWRIELVQRSRPNMTWALQVSRLPSGGKPTPYPQLLWDPHHPGQWVQGGGPVCPGHPAPCHVCILYSPHGECGGPGCSGDRGLGWIRL